MHHLEPQRSVEQNNATDVSTKNKSVNGASAEWSTSE
uniref:Uncharacterized protein n=1 Tax=Arundo donax TaxID=35708 RepID=A0A0A9GYU7_ARUDO